MVRRHENRLVRIGALCASALVTVFGVCGPLSAQNALDGPGAGGPAGPGVRDGGLKGVPSAPDLAMLLGPIDGLTTGWYEMPAVEVSVPAGVTVRLRQEAPPGSVVEWFGAEPVSRDATGSVAQCVMEKRRELWAKLAGEWKPDGLEAIATETVGLDGLPPKIDAILQGQTTGRIVVRVNDEANV